ncbi:MAG TPA: HtaA domain-containing protein [Solirubrobacterales bacterium]|nr:HtaA domain-containing protein [Solirubrobacterales bacterium]
MSNRLNRHRSLIAGLAAFFAVFAFSMSQFHGSASAADVTTGSVAITVSSGKAGKVSAVGPATVTKRIGKKGARVTGSVSSATYDATVGASVAGGIRFSNGKRRIAVTGIGLSFYKSRVVLSGKLGGKQLNVFKATGSPEVDTAKGVASLSGGKLTFTKAAAAKVRKALKLRKAPRGRIGGLGIQFNTTFVDQYHEQCGVAVDSRSVGSWPAESALPVLTGATATARPTSIDWGLRASFRGYIFGTMAAAGKSEKALQALDGAGRTNPPMSPTRGFSFPVSAGQYAANSPGSSSDDQAIINGTGTALFCNTEHFFWASIADPTIVIDGANSRIVATISQNINGNGMFGANGPWQTPQRVDLATLDLSAVTPTIGEGGTLTYTDIPVSMSASAAPFATYRAGTALDPITVTIGA